MCIYIQPWCVHTKMASQNQCKEDTWLPRLGKLRDHHHLGSYTFSAPLPSVFSQQEVILPASLRELTFLINWEMSSESLVEILQILRSDEKQQQHIPRSSSSSSNVSYCLVDNNLRLIISILSTSDTRRTYLTRHRYMFQKFCYPADSSICHSLIESLRHLFKNTRTE